MTPKQLSIPIDGEVIRHIYDNFDSLQDGDQIEYGAHEVIATKRGKWLTLEIYMDDQDE